MAGLPGISFSPLNAGTAPQGHGAASPLQDAIKILSFRMPSVVGAYSPSPLAGNLGDSVADNWLINLFKGLLPPGGPAPTPGSPNAPPMPPPAPQSPFSSGGPGGPGPAPQAPTWTGAPPPGPPPVSAPPPVVVYDPPIRPREFPPERPPEPPAPPAPVGPPDWRDWFGPRD